MSDGRWMTSTRSGLPVFVPDQQKPNSAQPFDHTRRIIDLETRVANLEAALAKMEER